MKTPSDTDSPNHTELVIGTPWDPQGPLHIPKELPILPLHGDVPFPQIIMPLVIRREKAIALVEHVSKGKKLVALATQTDGDFDDPLQKNLFPTVCVAAILKTLKFPDGSTRIMAQGLRRARIKRISKRAPHLMAELELLEETPFAGLEADALALSCRKNFSKYIDAGGMAPDELQVAVMNAGDAGHLCDLLASGLPVAAEEKHAILAEPNVRERLRATQRLLKRQVELNALSSKLNDEASGEMNRHQREQFLRQQLQAIRRELGEGEEEGGEVRELYDRLEAAELPEAAAKEARRELDRMPQMHPSTPEYHVIRTFLETILSMPWKTATDDRLDLRRARKILDEDHHGLERIKQRILEFLAVRKLKADMRGPILCFVGPPGVGKTSLGKSIARSMSRKFLRVSLGGVHDEAEIRGHRRTYIGAMPGRIVQGLRRLGVNNPVFMLDEIDKLGKDFRGDPSSALLEALDPEQNFSFRDHYLDVEFDLSKVMFICTANVLSDIPTPLRDRMEVIEISGYSEEEKLAIARKYLVPKQLKDHGLEPAAADFPDDGLRAVIEGYTHEAGLRNLEREIASLCRKIARQCAEGKAKKAVVDPKKVEALLGPPKEIREAPPELAPGMATGLAWTPVGGCTLSIEALRAPGKQGLKLTGSLGDVMKESAHAAVGYLHAHGVELKLPEKFLEEGELHIHVPAGAINKDGPSAGIAITSALLSLAYGKPVRSTLAMTGEITITGRVLAIGGVREKILAARRERFSTVIVPAANEKEVNELPAEIRDEFEFVFVRHMDEALPHLFPEVAAKPRRKGKAKIVRGKRYGRPLKGLPLPAPPPA